MLDYQDVILKRLPDGQGKLINVPHKMVVHSPTGMEWGYGGSGPADLALNILLCFTNEKTAVALHQAFKFEFIAPMPYQGGVITAEEILAWIKAKGELGMADNSTMV